jgi:predicted hydrocarbon binding protein/KaiC/GvpD/RAD55 family RecA-like ATPase
MKKRGVSLAEIQEVPEEGLILVAGPPGAGKSGFCDQAVLHRVAVDKPVIFVSTEQRPSQVATRLRERGLGESAPDALGFVDAYSQTVGVESPERAGTIYANCMDLNSISIATTRLQERMGQRGILLAFDSLTSPYLLSGAEVTRFMRLFLSKFAAEGNSVLALMDEGCGKEEDLGAMMSVADGIIRMEIEEGSRIINVVKHPKLVPTKIETPVTPTPVFDLQRMDPRMLSACMDWLCTARPGKPIRTEVADFMNLFWLNLAVWSGMLWDPKRLPTIAYESFKEMEYTALDLLSSLLPWHRKLAMKLFMPRSFSEVKDMKRFSSRVLEPGSKEEGLAIWEYVEDASKEDEHYFRLYDSASCWGFDDVGARLAHAICGATAGMLKAFEDEERDWNVVETKCIGLGDPYCEFKAVPGETDELRGFLGAIDSSVVEKVHDRLMDQLIGFLVHGKPLAKRARLGSGVWFILTEDVTGLSGLFSERYCMALRMGGAKAGKEVGEHLMNAEMREPEVIKRVIDLMNYCNVGKVTLGETIRIKENCESFGLETGQPSCLFATGFLNGLFSAVKNQHVKEIKCIAAGDPYCEWEII